MVLYIKRGCPWCDDAEVWLTAHGIAYKTLDVLSNTKDYESMRKISGQNKAPVLVTANGRVLADFGSEKLAGFLKGEGNAD